jgi:hypothetical protein
MSRTPLCYSRTITRTFDVCWLRSTLASEKRLGQGQHGQQSHRAADRAYREEEQSWFPKARAALGRAQLQKLGAWMESIRSRVPGNPAPPSAPKKAIDAVIS